MPGVKLPSKLPTKVPSKLRARLPSKLPAKLAHRAKGPRDAAAARLQTSKASFAKRRKQLSVLRASASDPLGFLLHLREEKGDVARFNLRVKELVLFSHPDHIQEVLVKHDKEFLGLQLARPLLDDGLLSSESEQHKRQRQLMMPAFHRERIRDYARIASDKAAVWATRWKDGQRIDVDEEMMRLTLEVTGETMLGSEQAPQAHALGEAITTALVAFRQSPFAPWTSKWPTPTSVRFRRARSKVDALTFGIIAERRAEKSAATEARKDLLAMLMAARDAEGQGMTNKELRDEALTLLVAGHETTALALTWTWHLLAQNPEAQAKLHAEVDEVLQGRHAEVQDVEKLRYTRLVLTEALRLYPPVWALGRKAAEDMVIRDARVRKGSIVIVSPYVTQHDPRFWPDPERFDPERHVDGPRNDERPKYAYFPFGGGPRVCLGEQLAWMEALLILATLAQRWRVTPEPGVRVERMPLLTLQPKGGLRLTVHARK